MYEQWANLINDHKLKYGDPSNFNIQPALVQISGPDFSKGPSPPTIDAERTRQKGELPELLVVCQKSNFKLAVGKDFKLRLYPDDDAKEAVGVGPCELFGLEVWTSWSSPTPCQRTCLEVNCGLHHRGAGCGRQPSTQQGAGASG